MKKAVALGYNEKDTAPKVLAKGEGRIADEIIKISQELDIPLEEDADLVEILSKININDYISEDLYKVIAELFAFLYRQNELYKSKK